MLWIEVITEEINPKVARAIVAEIKPFLRVVHIINHAVEVTIVEAVEMSEVIAVAKVKVKAGFPANQLLFRR